MTTGVNNPEFLSYNFPQDVAEQILSYLDDPNDLAALNRVDKQTHQFLTYAGHTPSKVETHLHRTFSKIGVKCPATDINNNNSVRSFLNRNKEFINKTLQGTLNIPDIEELAKNDQTDLIRKIFENTLLLPDPPWPSLSHQPYAPFSNLINNFSIEMSIRDKIYYGITSSAKCDLNKLAIKGTMTIGTRALDYAATECDTTYINTNFDRFDQDRLGIAFIKAFEKFYQTKERKYLELCIRILPKKPSEITKIGALKIIAKYGDEDIFFNILDSLSPFPINSLEEILFIAAINKNSKLLEKIIDSKLFKDNEAELLQLRWILPAILFSNIGDDMIAHWIRSGIPNDRPLNPLIDKKNHNFWLEMDSASKSVFSLPYLLIKHNRPNALKALIDIGGLKPGRYQYPSPSQIFSPFLQLPFTPPIGYNMLTAYKIEALQQEVVPKSNDLVREALCDENTKNMGDKLSFLSANGYANEVALLLGKATPDQIGKALIQAVTYRCADVVQCICHTKTLVFHEDLIDPPQFIPFKDYKKCLRIAAISGFTEIFQLLSSFQTNEPGALEKPLLDALIFGHEELVTMILGKHSNISVNTLERCWAAVGNLALTQAHFKILIQMLEQIPSTQISHCQPTLLIKVLERLILLREGEVFSKLLSYIAPAHLKEDFPSLMQKALDSKNEKIIKKLISLKRLL